MGNNCHKPPRLFVSKYSDFVLHFMLVCDKPLLNRQPLLSEHLIVISPRVDA